MNTWNGCRKIAVGDWVDEKGVQFGFSDFYNGGRPYSFLASPEGFKRSLVWGEGYTKRYFGESGQWTTETVFSETGKNIWEGFEGKSLLIVGGGPSANSEKWHNVKTDLLWSCNHFFKHPILSQRKIDLFAIGNEVDLMDKDLQVNMKKFGSVGCFETTNRPKKEMGWFQEKFPNQVVWGHTRYRSQIGVMPRLILLALFSGVKDISFVGMDGCPTVTEIHAFEGVKEPQGSPAKKGSLDVFKQQYTLFWDYVLNYLKPEASFTNLGEGVVGNLTTDISKEFFKSNKERESNDSI